MEETTTVQETPETSSPSVEDLMAEIDRLKGDNDKLRRATTAASADASKFKKQLQERMSEDERTKAEREEQYAQLVAERDSLLRASTISGDAQRFTELGFGDLSSAAAEALFEGKKDELFRCVREFIASHDKAVAATAVRSTPVPNAVGGANADVTVSEFRDMTYSQMAKLRQENPDLYETLRKQI